MKLKNILVHKLVICILVISFSLCLIIYFFKYNIGVESATLIVNPIIIETQEKAQVALPIRLKIPKINADSAIEYMGITPSGIMDSPKGPLTAGWFKYGTRPGEIGSAVIDGHSGWKNNKPALFDDLYKLKKGDKIYVENSNGTVTFIVREVKTYNPKADASNVFNSNDGKSHLNLITCTGIWDIVKKSHSDRLIVFTDKE